ncbi:MAG: aromatic amino acid lyase [Bacteroidales bacterium]|nr:aromatic amino acid lyase [Bacteroidales bacterium]
MSNKTIDNSLIIEVGNKKLYLDDFNRILFYGNKIKIHKEAKNKVVLCYNFLADFLKDKIIYGINTGFGPMAQYRIKEKDKKELQYNLIRSHSAGAGNMLTETYVKATMLARLNSLLQGYSGIHVEVVELLASLINNDIYPFIPEHGGVGASGDLVQLAHLALILIGEGEVLYKGELISTKKAFKKYNLKPIDIHIREGLSLINGTSVMTGIGITNIIFAKKLLNWSVIASSMLNEIVESYNDHFSKELNDVKKHEGQCKIAKMMRNITNDSLLIRKRHEHLFNKETNIDFLEQKVQEHYSLRCVPQILGPVLETINNVENTLINELNSVSDNPVIDVKNKNIFHGGNFHGDYVSLEMDKLKISITKLSILAERQLNFMLNHKINNILPPFVNLGKLGLNLGMQGAQFTATSTTAENQMLSNPMYVHNIPNNNDNQDIVSMGTNSALIAKKVIENSFEVIAIEFITIVQAIDYLKQENKLSKFSNDIYKKIRAIVPVFKEDSTKYKDINNIKEFLLKNHINID